MLRFLFSIPILVIYLFFPTSCNKARQKSDTSMSTVSEQLLSLSNYEDTILIVSLMDIGKKIERQMPDSAKLLYYEALKKAQYIGYNDGIANALSNLGRIYIEKGQLDTSLQYYNIAIPYCRKSESYRYLLPAVLHNIGTNYHLRGSYNTAVQYYDSAIYEGKRIKSPEVKQYLVNSYINIGSIYIHLDQGEKVLRYATLAIDISEKEHYVKQMIMALNNKGIAYKRLRNSDSAKDYFLKTLDMAKASGDITYIQNSYINIGTLFLEKNLPREAINYFKEAEKLQPKDMGFIIAAPIVYYNLGNAYYLTKNYNLSEKYLLKSLKYSDSIGIGGECLKSHQLLSLLYEATHKFPQALYHQRQYEELKDSIFSNEKIKDINELEVKYQTAEKDKQLLLQKSALEEKEHKLREKNFWIGSITAIVLLLSVLFVVLYRYRQRIQAKQIQLLRTEKEMYHLKDMMQGEEQERKRLAKELHDGIGGMLAAINMNLSAVHKQYKEQHRLTDLDPIMQMVEATTDEVRKTAHNLMPDILTRHSLAEAVQVYCEQVNLGSNLHIGLSFSGMSGNVSKSIELMLYRMVQELVQNIIKHAGATEAIVAMKQQDDKILIMVHDNGIGFDTGRNDGGYGLQNLRHRVQSLQGNISIESASGMGTTVYLQFDLTALKSIMESK